MNIYFLFVFLIIFSIIVKFILKKYVKPFLKIKKEVKIIINARRFKGWKEYYDGNCISDKIYEKLKNLEYIIINDPINSDKALEAKKTFIELCKNNEYGFAFDLSGIDL